MCILYFRIRIWGNESSCVDYHGKSTGLHEYRIRIGHINALISSVCRGRVTESFDYSIILVCIHYRDYDKLSK